MYVITKGSVYVSKPGSLHSYTNKLSCAALYSLKENAERAACDNETVVSLDELLTTED